MDTQVHGYNKLIFDTTCDLIGDTDNAVECVRAILNCDPTRNILNVLNHKGQTALHKAIEKKCEKMVRFLINIERGCDLGLKDQQGKTVLHHACSGPGNTIPIMQYNNV